MKSVRKFVRDILVNSLNTDQINHLARDVDPGFNLGEISGFGDKIVIPKKVAADCVIRHFASDSDLVHFVAYMISRDGQGMSGGVIRLKGVPQLVALMKERGLIYDQQAQSFKRDQSVVRTSDWGQLHEGKEYLLTLVSVDVVGSSDLIHKNVKVDLETTLSRLRAYVLRHVEIHDGRLWFWYGDGGIAAFYGEESNPHSVVSMLAILYYLPIFNVTENELRPDSNFRLRIGAHYGAVEYKTDVTSIVSPVLKMAQEIEKNFSSANSLAISEAIFSKLPPPLQRDFILQGKHQGVNIYRFEPR